MGQNFKEVASLRTDLKKYNKNHDSIFKVVSCKYRDCENFDKESDNNNNCSRYKNVKNCDVRDAEILDEQNRM
jgi:hypothetical protein